MVKSMTGYGAAKGCSGRLEISAEVKSVNNRYLDCAIKLPRVYSSLEDSLKTIVQKYVSRGKLDVFIAIDSSKADDVEIMVNKPLAHAYASALKSMADEYGLPGSVSVMDIARFPDVLQAEKREFDTGQLCSDICRTLEEALQNLDEMRVREGRKMRADISARLDEIECLNARASEISPRSVAEYRKKLENRMSEILNSTGIDEARILTEAALFAERTAINEETVRLNSHIAQLRQMLDSDEPVGRKIDFIVQEFNREANTIGSKGNDMEMSAVVVSLKAEIEKMREQAQNIE